MTELYVFQNSNQAYRTQVWPSTTTLPSGLIQEAREYVFELTGVADPFSVELYIDDEKLEALRPPDRYTARWKWKPGFYAGWVPVRLETADTGFQNFDLITDPDLNKLTRHNFDVMVSQILEDTHALFSLSGFRTGIAKGTGDEVPPLSRLEFLRSRFEELERTVNEIAKSPKRVMGAREKSEPYYMAKVITGTEIIRSFQSGRILRESQPSGRLPEALQGCFPASIKKRVKHPGTDIREHQDIKACLKSWLSWLRITGERLASAQDEDETKQKKLRLWGYRCQAMSLRLNRLLELPLFTTISDSSRPLMVTSIYRQVAQYRRFLELYRDINMGLSRIAGDFLQMPLARTFDLYELWCYLRLLRAAVSLFNIQNLNVGSLFRVRNDTGGVAVSAGNVVVPVTPELSLAFKKNYREYWLELDRRGSFSRNMIPDVSVSCNDRTDRVGAEKLIIMDAKYRIRQQLNNAISSIHMYRDALVEDDGGGNVQRIVVAAYLLSPDEPVNDGSWRNTAMPGRLFHPQYRTTFKFGAITLRPGMSLLEVENVLNLILTDAGVLTTI